MTMKKLLFLVILFSVFSHLNSQTIKPSFPGGEDAMKEFIDDKLACPQIFGKTKPPVVRVKFLVRNDGKIMYIHTLTPKRPKFDAKAIELVKSMPDWIPASRNGKNISLYQTIDINFGIMCIAVRETKEDIEVNYKYVEKMAEFPGGENEAFRYIHNNIKYPVIAMENGIQGKVIVGFSVEKDGSITDVIVLRGIDAICDKEAVRVVKSMPKWIPARQNGRYVKVSYSLPVLFKLEY
jgi:TonB family protein